MFTVAGRQMQLSKGEKTRIRRARPAIGIRIAVLYTAAFLLLTLLFFSVHRQREAKASFAEGVIVNTRIVPDHAIETKWGTRLRWKAEYSVAYSVAGREFQVWADSGVRGDTEADVRMSLAQFRRPCQVQYDPKKPETGVADCR